MLSPLRRAAPCCAVLRCQRACRRCRVNLELILAWSRRKGDLIAARDRFTRASFDASAAAGGGAGGAGGSGAGVRSRAAAIAAPVAAAVLAKATAGAAKASASFAAASATAGAAAGAESSLGHGHGGFAHAAGLAATMAAFTRRASVSAALGKRSVKLRECHDFAWSTALW